MKVKGLYVIYSSSNKKRWGVCRPSASRLSRTFQTKSQAIAYATKIVKKEKLKFLSVHNKDGSCVGIGYF